MFDDLAVDWPPLGRPLELLRRTWAVDHATQHLSRAMAAHLGLTGPQRLVLRVVGKRPGIAAGELATFLHLDASTLTGHIQRLDELGFLERRTAHDDARRSAIFLTARGKRLDVQTPGTVEAAMESVLVDMDAASVEVVESFLVRFAAALEAQTKACSAKARRPRRRPA